MKEFEHKTICGYDIDAVIMMLNQLRYNLFFTNEDLKELGNLLEFENITERKLLYKELKYFKELIMQGLQRTYDYNFKNTLGE